MRSCCLLTELTCMHCSLAVSPYVRDGSPIHALPFRVLISVLCWFDCRPALCKYACIGCEWTGPVRLLPAHEATCTFPTMTGQELFEAVLLREEAKFKEVRGYKRLLDLMSYENVEFVGMYEHTCFSWS